MNLQYINWKLHLNNPAEAEPEEFFKVFSSWIPDSPEVFIDVADYQHVQDGPVTLLVGHYVNYSLDHTGRRLGLLADHKQPLAGSNVEKLSSTLTGLLRTAKRLEEDSSFSHKPDFNSGDLLFIVNSRALAPNTADTFASVKPELLKVLDVAYGSGNYTLEHLAEPRQRFMVKVMAKGKLDLGAMIDRLG
jgi:hypothetical protein